MTTLQFPPLRIIGLEVENIKRIKTLSIKPTSNVVRINGENDSGKTSTLDSVLWALKGAGAIQTVPIRQGQERATITLTLGTGQTVQYIVVRSFRKTGDAEYTTKLTVESAAGALYPKPQQFLADLFGALSLDPLEFDQMSDKERLDTLKKIVVLELDVEELDRQNEGDFQRRTEINRTVKTLEERVNLYAGGIRQEFTDLTPIDISSLLGEMEAGSAINSVIERAEAEHRSCEYEIDRGTVEALRLRNEAEALIRRADAADAHIEEARRKRDEFAAAMAGHNRVDLSELSRRVDAAQRENTNRNLQRQARERHQAALDEFTAAQEQANKLTAKIEYRTKRKSDAIAGAKFPVPGLAFGEHGVLYNGLPYDQASGAQRLRVSFAIAASMKPKLPVVLIRDGSLLSEAKGMPLLEELAADYGAQVWIERVGAGSVGITLEEGEVVAVDGVPVSG